MDASGKTLNYTLILQESASSINTRMSHDVQKQNHLIFLLGNPLAPCVPVTFLRSRGKFMSGDTFPGGTFFSSEGRFFFFRGALFFLQRGSFWSVEYAEKKSGGHRPP